MSYEELRRYVACVLTQGNGANGQALGEFTLVLAFIAMVAVVALTALGLTVGGFYESFAGIIGG
jgi:Flp pilus assembly pilin Flp